MNCNNCRLKEDIIEDGDGGYCLSFMSDDGGVTCKTYVENSYKTIVAGSRDNVTYEDVKAAIEQAGWAISEVVSGTARGADKLGERWAEENNIPIDPYPAEWDKYGNFAGHLRNGKMANNAEALIAIWDGKSKGTKSMIEIAKEKGLKVFVYSV